MQLGDGWLLALCITGAETWGRVHFDPGLLSQGPVRVRLRAPLIF